MKVYPPLGTKGIEYRVDCNMNISIFNGDCCLVLYGYPDDYPDDFTYKLLPAWARGSSNWR